MSRLWPALLLAGCAAIAPASERSTTCGAVSPSKLRAIHFLSAEVGVGLTSGRCVTLAITRDGGRTWVTEGTPLPRPPLGVYLEQLTATSTTTAWVSIGVGPLRATSDGGRTWTVQPVPEPVVALTITRKTLWALGCPHTNNVQCRPALARERLSTGDWSRVRVPGVISTPVAELFVPAERTIVVTARPSTNASFSISADGGRHWHSSAPYWMGRPCFGGYLATAGARDWWTICLGNAAAGSSTKALLHTTNGGQPWRIASQVTSLTAPPRPGAISRAEPNALAAGSRTRLWLAFQNSMAESEDAGRTWSAVPGVNAQGMPSTFDVLSPTRAWLLAAGEGLWRTTDGRHWHRL